MHPDRGAGPIWQGATRAGTATPDRSKAPLDIAGDLDPERFTGFLATQVARRQPMLPSAGATLDRGGRQCVFAYSLLYPGHTIAALQHVGSS